MAAKAADSLIHQLNGVGFGHPDRTRVFGQLMLGFRAAKGLGEWLHCLLELDYRVKRAGESEASPSPGLDLASSCPMLSGLKSALSPRSSENPV